MHQYLLVRTEGMSPPQLAAFVSGWSSALDLVRRVNSPCTSEDASEPSGSTAFQAAIEATINGVLDAIEAAQHEVLDDDPDP